MTEVGDLFLDRRDLLRSGATALLAASLASCGKDAGDATDGTSAGPSPSSTDAAAEASSTTVAGPAVDDVTILRTASSVEELAIAVYQRALDSGLLASPGLVAVVTAFQDHHREHSALFQSLTRQAGGEPLAEANAELLAELAPRLDALASEGEALALLGEIETNAAQTFRADVTEFDDATLGVATMSVCGVEARHAALLDLLPS